MSPILFGKDIQQQLIIHMARDSKVLETAVTQLSIDDFSWEVCKVVAQALYTYYNQYRALPNVDVLGYEIQQLIKGARGDVIQLYDADLQNLANLLLSVRNTPSDRLNPGWALNTMGEYQTQVRLKKAHIEIDQALRTGVGINRVAQQLGKLTVNNEAKRVRRTSMTDMKGIPVKHHELRHITTGIAKLDSVMAGGFAPGELILLAACQGVGKTNMMLNFGLSAIKEGYESMFMSLEMPDWLIKGRVMAMGSHVPAMMFNKPLEEFDTVSLQRLQRFQHDAMDSFSCYDCSTASVTYAMVEGIVMDWVEYLENEGKRHKAGSICIDYLDRISHAREYGGGKSDLDPAVLKHVVDCLKHLSNRINIPIIIATQANRSADGAQLFHRKHISWGFNKIDAIDWGFGIAAKEDTRVRQLAGDDDDTQFATDSGITTSGRKLVISSFKSRRGNELACDIYQAPTLRIYNTKRDYDTAESIVNGTGTVFT